MTTVSLIEINSPASLRTCGSSISSLVHRRTRLQSFSPDKRAAAFKARTPDLKGRVSVSPKVLGLEGTQLVSSPAESPVPRPSVTPYSGRQSRFASDEFSSSESLDEFSDEDLDGGLDTDPEEIDDKRKLCVLGSRQKLYCPYDVANLKVPNKTPTPIVHTSTTKQTNPIESDRESVTSPENPPPSPINFLPSLDGFVVGGQKLICPEKSTTSQEVWCSNSRDFKPGFVKYPLYHCTKCADRVVEEEQTEVALQRRRSCLLHSRMSTHRHHDDTLQSVGSRLGRDSQMLMGSLSGMSSGFPYPDSSGYYDKSFVEIYMQKKKEKEERDKEEEEEKQRRRERRRNGDKGPRKPKPVKYSTMRYQPDNEVGPLQPGISDELVVMSVEKINKSSSTFDDSDAMPALNRTKQTKTSCSDPVLSHKSTYKARSMSPEDFHQTPEMEQLQVRCCRSDIFPFPEDENFIRQDDDEMFSYNLGNLRCKSRITPFYPLVRPSAMNDSETKNIRDLQTSSQSNETLNQDGLQNETSFPAEVEDTGSIHPPPSEHDFTMTATVIVPSRDTPCDQWVSFSADNEPVLNNSPEVDDGCDTFLKRLQRTKLSTADPSLPSGQQFCFEAVVDKRYNRWKRRRRRKKEGELRRAVRPVETESSDDNDDRNSEVENILDQMYDQIHGPAPLTPNGSRDTPRLRNRRRRTELTEHKNDVSMTSSDPAVANYDASSEWTSSDKDSGQSSSNLVLGQSNSGLWQCVESTVNMSPTRKSAEMRTCEDGCYWPQLEEYKEQILKTIQNTPQDQLEAMDQKNWLPNITLHYNGRQSGASQRSDHEEYLVDEIDATTPTPSSPPRSSNSTPTTSPKPELKTTEQETKETSNMYKKWSKSNTQHPRNSFSSSTPTKLLSRTGASTWGEMGSSQKPATGTSHKAARQIGVVTLGENCIDSKFKASLRPIKSDNVETSGQIKNTKKAVKEQPKVKSMGLNLPALSKNLKSQTFPSNIRRDNSLKAKKKPQTPGKPTSIKQHIPRPKTQPLSVKRGSNADAVDSNMIFRDYYLKTLFNERMRINSHVGPGKKLKKTITVDQLDLGSRKTRKSDDKLSDLAFTRSFTFSMFDLPEVYKMYNSNLIHRATGEMIDASD